MGACSTRATITTRLGLPVGAMAVPQKAPLRQNVVSPSHDVANSRWKVRQRGPPRPAWPPPRAGTSPAYMRGTVPSPPQRDAPPRSTTTGIQSLTHLTHALYTPTNATNRHHFVSRLPARSPAGSPRHHSAPQHRGHPPRRRHPVRPTAATSSTPSASAPPPPTSTPSPACFGTANLSTILAHLNRGLLRAAALERVLLARAATGQDIDFVERRTPHAPNHSPPQQPPNPSNPPPRPPPGASAHPAPPAGTIPNSSCRPRRTWSARYAVAPSATPSSKSASISPSSQASATAASGTSCSTHHTISAAAMSAS